jgi:hypothetical protein
MRNQLVNLSSELKYVELIIVSLIARFVQDLLPIGMTDLSFQRVIDFLIFNPKV